jgi:soluble lytic murein transglycosylase
MHAMPRRLRALLFAVALLAARPATAQDVMDPVHADLWADAAAAAAQYADPVAAKLVTFYRLLAPGAATAPEIVAFMKASPDWPFQAILARRRDEALATDPDDAAVIAQCDATPPTLAAAMAHCAGAYGRIGRAADSAAMARRAWIALPADAQAETLFMQHFAALIRPEDEWRRFERLAWTDTAAAARQELRLTPADHPRADAWLALKRDDPTAPALLAALPPAQRAAPALILEQARSLRRTGQDAAAQALWLADGTRAERAAPPERRTAFWAERNILIRRRLRDGDAAGAYAIADGHAQTAGEGLIDAEFLAGFIALRRLGDTTDAARHFQRLADASPAGITQGRAHYWLGRTATARGDAVTAKAQYAQAAAWPNTYYGQLAALRLDDSPAALLRRIMAVGDPPADASRALDLAGRELARAAAYLVGWGEKRRAEAFLLRLNEVAPDPPDRALAARLSLGFAMPDAAIAIARRAGTAGVILLGSGWPVAADIPPSDGVEPALALGIIRQESSFDGSTVSPVGARGLMQLMPGTAAQIGRALGMRVATASLTEDPAMNIQLGTSYLRQLLGQFAGSAPLAIAAYNAGPNRVQEWLAENGDPGAAPPASGGATAKPPAAAGDAMIDWIELIPFGETRNYVQRVIENEMVYRAERGVNLPDPVMPPVTR